jgi:hypothetical protein
MGASKWHWINYDEDKLRSVYASAQGSTMGTRLHAFAAEAIALGIKQKATKNTLNMYINDAIGFKMTPEVVLYFSENCFGTADAIGFRDNKLRIHDLKTGTIKAHEEQLYIYEALFCLEYNYEPKDIDIELRIYQSDDVDALSPEPEKIKEIMDIIIHDDQIIDKLKQEEI